MVFKNLLRSTEHILLEVGGYLAGSSMANMHKRPYIPMEVLI